MEKLSMCRVCLGEDIRLVAVVGTHLQEMYESLVLMPFKTEDSRPILACYICRARLKNCYELRKSCLQSEELFTQMLSCNESEEVQLQAINNKKRLTTHNVIHFSVGHVLGMDADSVGVEDLKCEVKDEPNDDEDTSEDVLEENSISDDVLPADSDKKNQESMEHEVDADSVGVETLVFLCDVKDEQSDREDTNEDVLEENSSSDDVLSAGSDKKNQESMEREVDADSVGVETLVILCDVKDEQSDREDIGAYILEENGVSANMKSEDLDDDFLINVKEEQIGNKTNNITLDLQVEYNDSLPNISTGFFDKHYPLEDEIMNDIMDDLGIEVLNKNKFQTDQIMPIPFTSTPTFTRTCPQSEGIDPDGPVDDNIERMSITPTPSMYNSFASSPSPAHDLLEPNQTHQSVNSGNNAITSIVNCQSPVITTADASSASGASSECSTPSNVNGKRRRQFSIDRSKRKRLRNKDKWIDTRRKLLLNSGEQHLSRNGKIQLAKSIKPPCGDVCKFKCCLKISPQERKNIFDRFWALADHEKQWGFIGKYTKRNPKKRITTENDSKRNFSVTYTLPVSLDKSSPRSVKVCKTMFKNTLSISNQFIFSALDKYDKNTGDCLKDLRGHHENKNKINTTAVIEGVCNHVKSFQPVESHYLRKDSNKLYLSGDLNFSIMFKLYQAWAEENNVSERVRTLRQYRDIVNREMNICFFIPKKDQCDVCTAFKSCPNTQNADDFDDHMKNKDVARYLKKQDKIQAAAHPDTVTSATFDFQKILSTPHGVTSSFYYKQKLSIINFTVFEMGLKKGICYMWPETTAKRGSNEVASCLLDFIEISARKGIKDVRLWSDYCAGQNRNRAVFFMYVYCASKFKINICHRFLEKGHTQHEGDSVHALIERTSKRKFIYSPEEWYTLVRRCKTSGDPYEVKEITKDMIFDFKECLDNLKWTKNVDNENVKWSQVREIAVKADYPNIMFYKYDLHENESKRIDLSQKRRTRSRRDKLIQLKKSYNETLMITNSKYNDLINLCEQNLIPARYHEFYKKLKHNSNIIENETD